MFFEGRSVYIWTLLLLSFGAGVLIGQYTLTKQLYTKTDLSEVGSPYKFINPLLFCQDQNLGSESVNNLNDEVQEYISNEKKAGHLSDASFYFRDLNDGPWTLINPRFRTTPASLLKVPLAISVYEHSEKDPSFLQTKITLTKDGLFNANEHFPPREQLTPGTPYSIEELVRYMLQDSDNTAVAVLGGMFTLPQLQDAYTRLGIRAPEEGEKGYSIGVKTFASFFRVLYSGTYLSRDNSEHLLSVLSHTSFEQGLVAGVPKGTVVSHKFGEATAADGTRRLNDCGIVYKPGQPYLLCIMTAGNDFDMLAESIAGLSSIVYNELSRSKE